MSEIIEPNNSLNEGRQLAFVNLNHTAAMECYEKARVGFQQLLSTLQNEAAKHKEDDGKDSMKLKRVRKLLYESCICLGQASIECHRSRRALTAFNEALNIAKESNNRRDVITAMIGVAQANFELNDFRCCFEAASHALILINLSNTNENSANNFTNVFDVLNAYKAVEFLCKVHAQTGNSKEELLNRQLAVNISKSLTNFSLFLFDENNKEILNSIKNKMKLSIVVNNENDEIYDTDDNDCNQGYENWHSMINELNINKCRDREIHCLEFAGLKSNQLEKEEMVRANTAYSKSFLSSSLSSSSKSNQKDDFILKHKNCIESSLFASSSSSSVVFSHSPNCQSMNNFARGHGSDQTTQLMKNFNVPSTDLSVSNTFTTSLPVPPSPIRTKKTTTTHHPSLPSSSCHLIQVSSIKEEGNKVRFEDEMIEEEEFGFQKEKQIKEKKNDVRNFTFPDKDENLSVGTTKSNEQNHCINATPSSSSSSISNQILNTNKKSNTSLSKSFTGYLDRAAQVHQFELNSINISEKTDQHMRAKTPILSVGNSYIEEACSLAEQSGDYRTASRLSSRLGQQNMTSGRNGAALEVLKRSSNQLLSDQPIAPLVSSSLTLSSLRFSPNEEILLQNTVPGPGKYDTETPKLSGGKFSTATPKSQIEWLMHHSKSIPGPKYESINLNKPSGGRFNTSNPKSEVEWKMYEARQKPGPGEYQPRSLTSSEGVRFSTSKISRVMDDLVQTRSFTPGPSADLPSTLNNKGQQFNVGNSKSDIEWQMFRAKTTPGPGYQLPSTLSTSGNHFNVGNSKSDIEWKIYEAKSKPGPGEYNVSKERISGGKFNLSFKEKFEPRRSSMTRSRGGTVYSTDFSHRSSTYGGGETSSLMFDNLSLDSKSSAESYKSSTLRLYTPKTPQDNLGQDLGRESERMQQMTLLQQPKQQQDIMIKPHQHSVGTLSISSNESNSTIGGESSLRTSQRNFQKRKQGRPLQQQ